MSVSPPRFIDAPFETLARHRSFIWALAMREIRTPHAGQMLGPIWALIYPLFFIALLAFIFDNLLGARFGGTVEFPHDYSTFILAGLVPWQTLAIVLGRGTIEIIGNANMVKQVVFPSEVLPIRGVIASLPIQLVGSIYLVVHVYWTSGELAWTWVLLPVVFVLQLLSMFGCALLLSALSVYLRDVIEVVKLYSIAGLYLAPIIYIPGSIPAVVKPLIYLNPFSYMIWVYQDVCYYGRIEHPIAWLVFVPQSLIFFIGGFHVFQRLKTYFGNAL